jgi:hypothetical protein
VLYANLTTSYCDGLGQLLSGIAAYINSFILSATMAWRISVIGSRFRFSHKFIALLVKQVEDCIEQVGDTFNDDGDKEFTSYLDSSLNSKIYQPTHPKFDYTSLLEFSSYI